MKKFPDQYKKQIEDAYDLNNQTVTFEKVHKIVGTLDFDQDYIDNYDFDNLPEHLDYKNSFYTMTGQKNYVNIIVNDMKDQFYESVRKFAEDECGFTFWEGHLLHWKQGFTPLHKDVHLGFRTRSDLLDLIPDDKLYDLMRKFWIPLSDRKPGHYFEINGVIITDWKAGDLIEFQSKWSHCGANCGPYPRNALVLTGTTVTG